MKHTIIGAILGLIVGYFIPYFNTFNFPLGFMLIGLGLGIIFSNYLKENNSIYERLFWIYIFVVSGLAYSGVLNLRYETSMGVSDIPLFFLFFPLAVSAFIFIFCISFLSLKKINRKLINILAILILLSGILLAFVHYLWLPSFLASFLVWVSLLIITISYFYKEKIDNLALNLSVLFILYIIGIISLPLAHHINSLDILGVIVVTIGILAFIISLIGNIIYAIDFKNRKIQGKISLSWLASFSSIICNYTIFLSFICILVYRRTANFLYLRGQLSKLDLKIAFRLALSTFFIHLIYMFSYETFLQPIWRGYWTVETQISNAIVWGLCTGLASYSLGNGILSYKKVR